MSYEQYHPSHPEYEIVQYAEQTSFGVKFRHHAVNNYEIGLTHDNLARLDIVSGLEGFNRALTRELGRLLER